MNFIKIGDQGFWEDCSGLGISRGYRPIESPVVKRYVQQPKRLKRQRWIVFRIFQGSVIEIKCPKFS